MKIGHPNHANTMERWEQAAKTGLYRSESSQPDQECRPSRTDAVETAGVPVSSFSIWRKKRDSVPPETGILVEETVSLFPMAWPLLIGENGPCARRFPSKRLRLVAFLLTRRHELSVNLCKAWGWAYAAREMARQGVNHIRAHFASSLTSVALACSRLTGASFSFTTDAADILAHRIMRLRRSASRRSSLPCRHTRSSSFWNRCRKRSRESTLVTVVCNRRPSPCESGVEHRRAGHSGGRTDTRKEEPFLAVGTLRTAGLERRRSQEMTTHIIAS